MQLYSSSAKQFIRSCETNQIAEKLLSEFSARFGGIPGHSEIASWRNSLRAFADVLRAANFDSQGVLLEYRIPLTSLRVDCILTGRDKEGNQRAVAVELKQWTKAEADEGENEVTTFVGKGNKVVLHPSVQVQNYVQYLADTHEEFHSDTSGIKASGCAYLHNYAERENDPLLELKFSSVLKNSPLFNLDQTEQLIEHLQSLVGYGEGLDIMARVEKNSYRASKMLMKHVSDVVKGLPTYTLLDDQLVTLDAVMSAARKSFNGRKNNVIVVRGGPGTGKSVVALNLLGQLMREGYSTNYATGSKAFTDTIRKIVGRRGSSTLKFTDSYVEAESKVLDVLIVDEAHRIREFTQKMFRPKSELPQFEELFNAAKTLVLFIDDDQTVRPKEIGSVQYLRDHATRLGATVTEFELEAQFRCGGAKEFISWIDSTLQIREADDEEWVNNPDFDFQIVESPELLEEKIMGKIQGGYSARMVAGFCWPWSKPNANGTLVEDVCVSSPTEGPIVRNMSRLL